MNSNNAALLIGLTFLFVPAFIVRSIVECKNTKEENVLCEYPVYLRIAVSMYLILVGCMHLFAQYKLRSVRVSRDRQVKQTPEQLKNLAIGYKLQQYANYASWPILIIGVLLVILQLKHTFTKLSCSLCGIQNKITL